MRISYNLQTEWLVQVDPRCYSYLTPLSWTDLKLMRTSLDHFAPTNGKLNLTLYYFTISIIFFFIPFWIARINFGLCYSTCHLQLLFFSLFFLLLQQLPILHDFAFHPSLYLSKPYRTSTQNIELSMFIGRQTLFESNGWDAGCLAMYVKGA